MGYGVLGKLVEIAIPEITSFLHCLLGFLFDPGFGYVRGTVSLLYSFSSQRKARTLDDVTTILRHNMGFGILGKLAEITLLFHSLLGCVF